MIHWASTCWNITCVLARPGLRCATIIPLFSLDVSRDVGKPSVTAAAYADCPLNGITPQLRGCVLETVARRTMEMLYSYSVIKDPIPGQRCNGGRRSLWVAEYDWLHDDRRVQCKSAQMYFGEAECKWRVHFCGIKLSLFDDLILVLYSPSGLSLFKHAGKTRLSSNGVRTSHGGHRLHIQSQTSDWREAEDVCFKKLHLSGEFITSLKTSDQLVLQALEERTQAISFKLQREAYAQHPLNSMTPAARGLFLQRVVQEADVLCHPGTGDASSTATGSSCDWIRDGLRVECKSARLSWSQASWTCVFQGIKFEKLDVLYLALDTPHALHIFRFGGSKWVHSTGLMEAACGKNIQLHGPRQEKNLDVAVEVICQKLVSTGSQQVASVVWQSLGTD